jgi:hypothetical protein
MSDVSRACARCRLAAVVARGGTAYCLDCNEIMDWSDVIAVVQNASEVPPGSVPLAPSAVTATDAGKEPALTGGGGGPDTAGPDPFSQRLI